MIPKVIHYCWLSKNPMPVEAMECIKSWKRHLPDWEMKLWDMDSFDVNSVKFVRDAVAARKWAFAADYIRAYAIYTEGGVYLDSDVMVRKNMDFVLENRAFSAVECYPDLVEKIKQNNLLDEEGNKRDPKQIIQGIQIQAAIIGGEKGHPFFKECLDYYQSTDFITDSSGIPYETMISPVVFATLAEKYGFKYVDKEQCLDSGFKIYPSKIFAPQAFFMNKNDTVAVHCCNGSWRYPLSFREKTSKYVRETMKRILYKMGLRKETGVNKLK